MESALTFQAPHERRDSEAGRGTAGFDSNMVAFTIRRAPVGISLKSYVLYGMLEEFYSTIWDLDC